MSTSGTYNLSITFKTHTIPNATRGGAIQTSAFAPMTCRTVMGEAPS